MLFGYLADKNAKYYPDKAFLVYENRRCTFGEFNSRTNALARGLLNAGLKPSHPRFGQNPFSLLKVLSPGRGDRPVARSARRILRKPVGASEERASPADAFCPEAPRPRATTEASRKCQTPI